MSAILRRKALLFILFCLLLVGSGCATVTPVDPTVTPVNPTMQPTSPPTPWPTVIDRGLLFGDPCDPPCWEGIAPDISTEEDVVRTFERLKDEGRIKGYAKTSWGCDYRAEFSPEGSVCIRMIEGSVLEIMVVFGRVNHRVWQIIERLGEPSAYAPYSAFEREADPCERRFDDSLYYALPSTVGYLLYPSLGVTVFVRIPDGYTGCLCPEMWAYGFSYYRPRSLTEALQESEGIVLQRDWGSEDLVPWHGYGCDY